MTLAALPRPVAHGARKIVRGAAASLAALLVRSAAAVPAVLVVTAFLAAPPRSLSGQQAGSPAQTAPDGAGVLRGVVIGPSGGGVAPLAHARVKVAGRSGAPAGTTDETGEYELVGLPSGIVTVMVERLGYRPLDVDVRIPAGAAVVLDLVLEPSPLVLGALEVRAPVPAPTVVGAPERLRIEPEVELRALESSPGFSTALLDAARSVDASGDDPGRVLLTRGSTADQRLMLLDGAPVYAPFHLGGLLPSFDPGLLESARHWVGGAPARYDGGLSYVLDLRTRPGRGDALSGRAFVDLLGVGATVEGPAGADGSFLVSGRGLHPWGPELAGGGASPFEYGELLGRGDFSPARGHDLSVTAFWNRETVVLGLGPADGSGAAHPLESPEGASWGNGALSVRYRATLGASSLRATVAGSRYRASLPLGISEPAYAAALTRRTRLATELSRAAGAWELTVGMAAERVEHEGRARVLRSGSVQEVAGRSRREVLSLHAQGDRDLGPDLRFRGGLRLDHFPGSGAPRLSPRAALEWRMTDDASLTLSGGRFHQIPSGAELELGVALDDPGGLAAGRALWQPAEATHLVLSLDQELTAGLDLGLDGYVKGFRDLPATDGQVLRSSGVDLAVRRSGSRIGGWIGYSLAWFWTPGTPTPGDDGTGGAGNGSTSPGTRSFTGRHLLSVGTEGRLGDEWGARLSVTYGDGLPYTSVPLFDARTAATELDGGRLASEGTSDPDVESPTSADAPPALDGFLRVDLEVSGAWDVELGGRRATLRPYLRVLNAVASRDALFHYFEPWRDSEIRALAERPFLPLLGAEIRF